MNRRPLFAILALALAVRLLNAFLLPGQGGDLVLSDMKGYDRAAVALWQQTPISVHTAEQYIFHPLGSDTYHPPGYYYVLAAIYAVAGHSYLAVRLVQSVMGTLTCLIIYLIARDMSGERAGLGAALVAALYPPLIFYTGVLLTETSSMLWVTTSIYLLVRWSTHRSERRLLALAGLALGLTAITRSVLLVAAPAILLWMLWLCMTRVLRPTEMVQAAVCLLIPVALVIAPVTIRNYQIHHRLILVATNGGVNVYLAHGGNEHAKNQIRNLPAEFSEGQVIGISPRTQPEEEATFYRLAWQHVRTHPIATIRRIPGQLVRMYWDADYWPATDSQLALLAWVDMIAWKAILLPLSLAGIPLLRRTSRQAVLLYLVILATTAVPIVFWAMPRFRLPIVPLVIVTAACTVPALWAHLPARRRFAGTARSQ